MIIRKAVFPVAGMGTRFLPATKANPKEMLPIVDKPLIQYAVEEAISAGITEMIFVTSSSKRAIEDHFDSNYELEMKLKKAHQKELLDIVKNILPSGISCAYVRQTEALGLGHAVLSAAPVVGNEPFAVILADDLIDAGKQSCMAQMIALFQKMHHSILAVEAIPIEHSPKYGVVKFSKMQDGVATVSGIVEKPLPLDAPSNLGVVGRYILTPEIFSLLAETSPGFGNEIQLTDAIAQLLQRESVSALPFRGVRYDCGSKLGYLQATVAYALKHKEVSGEFREYIRKLNHALSTPELEHTQ